MFALFYANVIAVRHARTDVPYIRLFYNIIRLVLARTLYSCSRWPAAMSNAQSIRIYTGHTRISSRLLHSTLLPDTSAFEKYPSPDGDVYLAYVREQVYVLIENHLRNKKDAARKRRENIMRAVQSDKTLLHTRRRRRRRPAHSFSLSRLTYSL
uniref:Uncharacterized protein n=1 Tax=Trichogramma kaykai TaxID=54128 RepID=A0ABD2XNE4_9HYME